MVSSGTITLNPNQQVSLFTADIEVDDFSKFSLWIASTGKVLITPIEGWDRMDMRAKEPILQDLATPATYLMSINAPFFNIRLTNPSTTDIITISYYAGLEK